MGITAVSGPYISYGITTGSSGNVSEYNDERGPSIWDLGQGTQDPRNVQFGWTPGQGVGTGAEQVRALWDGRGVIDFIPFTATASAIAQSTGNTPVAGAALTLNAVSSLGAFQTTIIAPETGKAVSVIAIDSTAQSINFGVSGTVGVWNPAAGTGRAIAIVTSCAATEAYFVRGRDMYGFKMTELISGSTTSSGSGQGRKAFKYITSVTASTSSTFTSTGVAVGFNDIFGMPLYMPYVNGTTVQISSGNATAGNVILLTTTNSLVGSTIAVQTSTTPDVRGVLGQAGITGGTSIATNGTSANGAGGYNPTSTGVRVTIYQPVTANMAAAISLTSNTSAWFGATQFSDF